MIHVLFANGKEYAVAPHKGLIVAAHADTSTLRGSPWLRAALSETAYVTSILPGQAIPWMPKHNGVPVWDQPWWETLSKIGETEDVFIAIDLANDPMFETATFKLVAYPDPPLDPHIRVYDDAWTHPRSVVNRFLHRARDFADRSRRGL